MDKIISDKPYINGNYKVSQKNIERFYRTVQRHIDNGVKSRMESERIGEYWVDTHIEDRQGEIWKEINYFGVITHKVSNYGRVKSLVRKNNRIEIILKPGKIRSSNDDPKNYYLIYHLTYLSQSIYKLGHVLVAEHFISNPENKPQVNHKNGIKRQNNVENLEWNTQVENLLHSYAELGRTRTIGTNHGLSKMNDEKVIEARMMYKNNIPIRQIALKFGVAGDTISSIIKRKTWKHID